MTRRATPDRHPASLFPWLGKEGEPPTNATSGLSSSGSSASVGLTACLVSRLRDRLGSRGLMLFAQTWREKATPSGWRYWEHTASVPRIGDSESTGALGSWPTPAVTNADRGGQASRMETGRSNLQDAALLAPWTTPQARDYKGADLAGPHDQGGKGAMLNEQVRLTAWPTPMAGSPPATESYNEAGNTDSARRTAALLGVPYAGGNRTGWPTARSTDGDKGVRTHDGSKTELDRLGRRGVDLPTTATLLIPGPTSNGSPAETGSIGQLNVAFSRWLQGYPPEWDECAPTASAGSVGTGTPSPRRSRQRSSAPSSTPSVT